MDATWVPGAPRARWDQAAQMRVPLCLLLLVAHAADMLPLNRRKKQGTRGTLLGRAAGRYSRAGKRMTLGASAQCPRATDSSGEVSVPLYRWGD